MDDDHDLREIISDVLQRRGYSVATAADGMEALDHLRSHEPPCLILLDWMMPRCNGAQFRAEQRKDPALSGVPVVLLTADANRDQKMQAVDAADYLLKPVPLKTLLNVVGQYC